MPALPSPGKVIRVVLECTDGSDTRILNRCYFSYTGSVSGADATSVGTTFITDYANNMGPFLVSTYATEQVTVTDLGSATGVEEVVVASHAGTNGGTKLTSGTAMVLSAKISRRYRGGHPRVYLTGFPESFLQTSNTWTTTAQGDVFTAWTDTLAAITSSPPADLGTVAEVNVSFYEGFISVQNPITLRWRNVPKPRTTPVVDNITSWATNPKVASQRRRNQQSL